MGYGRHKCNKSKTDSTYSKKWSGVSFAPHTEKRWLCPDCFKNGEEVELHDEDGNYYCPACDNYKSPNKRIVD